MLPRSMRSTSGVTTLSKGKCWCGKGRWLQVDPEAEKFYPLTPYNSMGNNPVSMVDPDGDAIFTAMLVGAAISTAINGVTNTINKQPFFKNGGIAAISGAVSSGLFVAGNIGTQISLNAAGYKAVALNATGSAVSSHLPSANVSFGN